MTAGGRILVVEDDQDTAMLLCDALRKRAFEVERVASGPACLEWLQSRATDVILVDVQMAGMSGIELCGELHAHHPDVVAVVLTAQADAETAASARRAGAFDVVTKPMRLALLFSTVARAMDSVGRRHAE
jgi:DNA-binding NtrC family response regulator|nr:response regulator [Kofleriaceae bacterium]